MGKDQGNRPQPPLSTRPLPETGAQAGKIISRQETVKCAVPEAQRAINEWADKGYLLKHSISCPGNEIILVFQRG